MQRFIVYVLKNRTTIKGAGSDIHPNMLHDYENVVRVELHEKTGSSSKCIHSVSI